MATVVGVSAAGATASSFLGNGAGTGILDTALLAASWVFIETSTAATQGTNADVQVWRDGSSRFVVAIEPFGQTLKFRAAEAYNSANDKFNQPVSGQGSSVAVTPTANSTVTDTEKTINVSGHTVAEFGFYNLYISTTGMMYVIDVTADRMLVSIGQELGVTTGALRGAFVFAGHATSMFQAVADTHPLFLGGSQTQGGILTVNATGPGPSWANNTSTSSDPWRTSRSPGVGAVSTTSAFCFFLDWPFPSYLQSTTAPVDTTYGVVGAVGGGASVPHGFTSNLVGQGVLHGCSVSAASGRGIFRAYTPGIVIALTRNQLPTGMKAYINGDLYYSIGTSQTQAGVGRLGGGTYYTTAFLKAI